MVAVGKPGGAVRTVSPAAGTNGKDTPPEGVAEGACRVARAVGSISSKAMIKKFKPAKGAVAAFVAATEEELAEEALAAAEAGAGVLAFPLAGRRTAGGSAE
jgi:hypothetical protein